MRWNYKITLCFWLSFLFTGGAHAENVLYLGDSHSVNTNLENSIYQSFHQQGDFFVSEAFCSSKPNDWVDNPKVIFPCWLSRKDGNTSDSGSKRHGLPQVSEIVKEFGPAGFDRVVIEQGDNMLGYNKAGVTELSLKLLRALGKEMRDKKVPCYWLGPSWPIEDDSLMRGLHATNLN